MSEYNIEFKKAGHFDASSWERIVEKIMEFGVIHRLPYTRIASWLLRSSKFAASDICDVLFKENITSREAFEEGLGDRWLALCNEIASFHASNIIRIIIMHTEQVVGREQFARIYNELQKGIFEVSQAFDLVSPIYLVAYGYLRNLEAAKNSHNQFILGSRAAASLAARLAGIAKAWMVCRRRQSAPAATRPPNSGLKSPIFRLETCQKEATSITYCDRSINPTLEPFSLLHLCWSQRFSGGGRSIPQSTVVC